MHLFLTRRALLCLVLLLPAAALAANPAMLNVSGEDAMLNGSDAPRSAALFVGDTVATPADSVASINTEGSMILVQAGSSVQFEGNAVRMGHGGVVITTSKAMAVWTGKLTIAPATPGSARFEVSDSQGVIRIAARQGDLAINDGNTTTILTEGQQTTRQDSPQAHKDKNDQGAAPSGKGVHLSRKTAAIIIGGAAAAGTTAAILLTTGNGSHPASPATP